MFGIFKQKNKKMIWYACYGSNLDLDRFLKYILGGKLIVNSLEKIYNPCPTDNNPPRQMKPYLIDRKFFFAKESKTWNLHGVGFISNTRNKKSKTFAKLYLISEAQFSHLFALENGGQKTDIDFGNLLNKGYLDFDYSFYNRIVLLEKNHEGYPILTFTNKSKLALNKPFKEYVRLIVNGLKLTHNLTTNEAFEYIVKKGTGARRKDLKDLLD